MLGTQRGTLLLAAVAMLMTAAPASAETLHIKRDTALRASPGEREKAVARLDSGQEVTVIKRKGRWLRVKSEGQIGWITRTHARPSKPQKRARTRTRTENWRSDKLMRVSQRERKNIRRVRVIEGEQDVFREPRGNARVVYQASAEDILTVIGKGKSRAWLLVENRHGHVGWIPAASVTRVSGTRGSARVSGEGGDFVDSGGQTISARAQLGSRRAGAALGYRVMAMDFSSNGNAELGNYTVSAQAMTASLGGTLPVTPRSLAVVAAIDAEYRLSYSSPGIYYQDAGGQVENIAFSMHEVRAGANLGYRVADSALLAARVGYHFGVFQVANVDNIAYMPSESLYGLTAGARADFAPGGAYLIRAGFDYMIGATRAQTAGLEDGAQSTAGAFWGHLSMDYALTAKLSLIARYAYERATTEWTGTSMRQADVTQAARTDQNHLMYLGLGQSF